MFNAVLIDRVPEERTEDPVTQMAQALDEGSSLIIFPEGQAQFRSDAPLLPFKSGLYHLARMRPEVDLVPVWIENLNRVMPKGEVMPVPLIVHRHLRRAAACGGGRGRRRPSSTAPPPRFWR